MEQRQSDQNLDGDELITSFRIQDLAIFGLLLIGIPVCLAVWIVILDTTDQLSLSFVALGGCIILLAWIYVKRPRRTVHIYQDRFCIEYRKQIRCVSWHNIDSLRIVAVDQEPGDDLITIQRFELSTLDGEKIKIRRAGAATTELSDLLRYYTAPHIMARWANKILMRETVSFGKVHLEPDGLRRGRKFTPKSQLAALDNTLENLFTIIVPTKNGSVATTIYRLGFPNDHVFPYIYALWLSLPVADET